MASVNVRDLRNHGGRVLDRIAAGETLTVTRHGRPIAELRPLPSRPLAAATLLRHWRNLPAIDPGKLKADLDRVLDPAL